MAQSTRLCKYNETPELGFDEDILDHVGVVGIWSLGDGPSKKEGRRSTVKAAYAVYFGHNCPQNLSETIMQEEESPISSALAQICAVTAALQIILTSIIAKAELT